MACCIFCAHPLYEPELTYCQLDPLGKIFNQSIKIVMQENAFKYVVCKMVAILFRPQCINKIPFMWCLQTTKSPTAITIDCNLSINCAVCNRCCKNSIYVGFALSCGCYVTRPESELQADSVRKEQQEQGNKNHAAFHWPGKSRQNKNTLESFHSSVVWPQGKYKQPLDVTTWGGISVLDRL